MALNADNLTNGEFSLAYKSQSSSVVITVDNKLDAESLVEKGWGYIKPSDNFGALFRIRDDAKEALNLWREGE